MPQLQPGKKRVDAVQVLTKKGYPQKGYPRIGQISPSLGHFVQQFLREISRNRPDHGYPFCRYPFGPCGGLGPGTPPPRPGDPNTRGLLRSVPYTAIPALFLYAASIDDALVIVYDQEGWDPADQLQESKTAPARKVKKESPRQSPGESPRRPGRHPKRSQK